MLGNTYNNIWEDRLLFFELERVGGKLCAFYMTMTKLPRLTPYLLLPSGKSHDLDPDGAQRQRVR